MVDITVRVADASDFAELSLLDRQCFPPGDPVREPFSDDELRDGLSGGRVYVAVAAGLYVGFIHFERPSDHHIYLSALAVHPAHRNTGVGSCLMKHLLVTLQQAEKGRLPSISAVTSPENKHMLHLLFKHGFVARTMMRGYAGPGQDRIYCHYKLRVDYVDPDVPYLVPTTAYAEIDRMLADDRFVIIRMVELSSGQSFFEFFRFDEDDLAGLQADETSISVTFAGTILAAITFVLGFALQSDSFPNAARVLLLAAVLATTMALVVYTNASGGIARLRFDAFEHHMRLGNILSEFGGMHPFLVALPVTFSYSNKSFVAGISMGVLFSVSLAMYERSRYSISSRFPRSSASRLAQLLVVTAPISGVLAIGSERWQWTWAIALLVLLSAISIGLMRNPMGEQVPRGPAGGFHIRG